VDDVLTRRSIRSGLGAAVATALTALALPVLGAAPGSAAPPAPAAVTAAVTTAATARVDPALLRADGAVGVVVRLHTGTDDRPRRAVAALGGEVTRELPVVDGFAATLPATAVDALAAVPGVAVLSEDRALQVQSGSWAEGGAALAPRVLQAPDVWAQGVTGRGVTVALLDTGIADVPDLAGRIVPVTDDRTGRTSACHDLSGERSCDDGFGHGTFMAGLVAGAGSGTTGPTGTAPEASLLSVKVAGADGAADVSTVLAGLQWVVSFADRYGIRVVNMSLGTDSTQSYEDDPLNYAVQRAWAAGIVVVVAAANTGPAPGSIAKPGDDPWVVTVGAVDSNGTPGLGDDRVPDFSSRGPTRHGVAKPDVVAPGARVLSLRAPGSTIDRRFPPADTTSPYRAGSGTSMATALVSGTAALALQANPALTPDEVKHALAADARPVASDDPAAVGAGLVDAATTALDPAPGRANQDLERSSGLGSLATSRGSLSLRLDDLLGTLLTGRMTAQNVLWDPVGWTTSSWTPSTWYTSVHGTLGWNSASWAGSNWVGSNWVGSNWVGSNWVGSNWVGSSWYGVDDERAYGRTGPGSASYGAWE
jgi:serine protease AprX